MGLLSSLSKMLGMTVSNSSQSPTESLLIPEPTRSLVWMTDEDPSLAESPTSINIVISLTDDGVSTSKKEKGIHSEPSMIWKKLRVTPNSNLEEDAMYWPTYFRFTPEQRYQYINWLRDITQPTNLSYVFLYFYGLERHLLVGNYDDAVLEIRRLLLAHKAQSFQSYAMTSLIMASLARQRNDIINMVPEILESEANEALLLRMIYGTSISAEDVIDMSSRVGFTNKRYIKAYPDLFKTTLQRNIDQFEKEYGPILKQFDISKMKKEERSVFANMSIPEEYRCIKIPQVFENKKFTNAMKTMLQNTHDEVKQILKDMRQSKNKIVVKNE
ncbi:MAG: TerB N-terminal domain-containing protein [Candidatus Dojkabacteria bacterium]|jgi:hypothetical protein